MKKFYEEKTTETITDGEKVKKKETSHIKAYDKEPEYVKFYLNHISRFRDIQPSYNPILIAFLKEATYADKKGGMVLYVNGTLKAEIAEECGVSVTRVNHAITEFVKADFIRKLAFGKYQFNPYLFGKGEWRDIREIRATFDYNKNTVVAEIIKESDSEEE